MKGTETEFGDDNQEIKMEQVDQGEKYICEQKQKNKLKRFQFDTTEEYIHKLRTSIALDKNLYRLYDSCSYNTE